MRKRCRKARIVQVVMAMLLCSDAACPSRLAAQQISQVLVPYRASGYRYRFVTQGTLGGFELPGFNDADWSVGNAPFANNSCLGSVGTTWSDGSKDLLLRRTFTGDDVDSGIVRVGVDDVIQVFINGHDVTGGLQNPPNHCGQDLATYAVPPGVISPGTNLLAVRARDTQCCARNADVEVTGMGLRNLDLAAPSNGGWCRPMCRFDWKPAPINLTVAKYTLYVDEAVKKDDLPPTTSEYTLSPGEALTEGAHTWRVRACDAQGSCLDSPNTFTVRIDGTPPPPFDLADPPESAWRTLNPSFDFVWAPTSDALSGLAGFTLLIDDQPRASLMPGETRRASATLFSFLSDGPHTWTVVATDTAGNERRSTTSRIVRMDSTPPLYPPFTPLPSHNACIGGTSVDLGWVAPTDAASGVVAQHVLLDNAPTPVAVDATTFSVTGPLAEGLHTWYVRASDGAGNLRNTAGYVFRVDTTGPAGLQLRAAGGTANGAIVSLATPPFCWTTPVDAGCAGLAGLRLFVDDVLSRDHLPPATSCSTPLSPLQEGIHSWYVEAFDALGNSARSESWEVVYDVNPPSAPVLLSPPDQHQLSEARPMLSWDASSDAGSGLARYEVHIDGICALCNVSPSGTTVVPTVDLSVGPHSWFVKAVDRAGHTTSSAEIWTFNILPSPSPTRTASGTPTSTPSLTVTATFTPTWTPTPSVTFAPTPSVTPQATPTSSQTSTGTATPTDTPTGTATPSPTSTATGTPSPTPTASATPTATVAPSETPTAPTPTASASATSVPQPSATPELVSTPTGEPPASPTPTPTPSCDGDCNRDGTVAINEIVIGVNIAAGSFGTERCRALDRDRNGVVTIDELVRAVIVALNSCFG